MTQTLAPELREFEMDRFHPTAKIGFVAQGDPANRLTFSGIAWHALNALRSVGPEIIPINSEATNRWERREARLHRLAGGRTADWLTLSRIIAQSKRVAAQLKSNPVDLLITTGTTHLAFVKSKAPLLVWNDAVFPSLVNYYESFTGLTPSYRVIGRWSDSSVTRKAFHCAYSSDWAAAEAKRHYGLPEKKLSTIPFGPCLEKIPERRIALTAPQRGGTTRLLFVGKEWDRKDGDSAVALAEQLRNDGIATELDLVGCTPPKVVDKLSFVRSHGILQRTNRVEAEKLDQLFRESTFLVVPSKAECCAQVYLEAASYGLPAIARDVGGTATAVRHRASGYLLGAGERSVATAGSWAKSLILDPAAYLACRRSARDLFESRLNWEKATEQISPLIVRALAPRAAA